MSDQRLTDLEIRYMKLEHTVEELSAIVATQQKTIDRVMKELSSQGSRLRDLDPTHGDEKPPHY